MRPGRWLHGVAPRRCDLIAIYVAAAFVHPVLPGLAAFVPLLMLKLVVGFAVHTRRDVEAAPAPTLGC